MKGGKRPGSGRPRGSGNKELQEVKDALRSNRDALVKKALKMALGPKPNIPVLLKLLDKVLPNLLSQELTSLHASVKIIRDTI